MKIVSKLSYYSLLTITLKVSVNITLNSIDRYILPSSKIVWLIFHFEMSQNYVLFESQTPLIY